jgi:D-alanyl-D-alanine carboxypeptidase
MTTSPAIHRPATRRPGTRKTTWAIIAAAAIVIILAGIAIAGWRYMQPAYKDLNQELQYRVSTLAGSDKAIKNDVLFVAKGDGSFTWSGAAGIASQDGQVPMTPNTPIYIASVTKLYTAAAIMRLYEQGKLALDDPMAKYLSDDLIGGIAVYQGRDYSHEITIAELLSQTSGLADYYEDKPAGGKALFQQLVEQPERVWTVEELLAQARQNLPPRSKPDTEAY